MNFALGTIKTSDVAVRSRAIERLARLRLSEIEEMRDVCLLWRDGLSQRDIAERLNTTQPRIGRIEKILGTPDRTPPESVEELILRTVVQHGDRAALVAALKKFPFTYGEAAPAPFEGTTTGTWDDIEDAYFEGLLTKDEYEEIRAVAGPDAI
ncbi:hypothetical protein ABKW28_10140 [Nocardioides sp. 31GB23]|uniref:hypothetical protein n=1 Tax=Nocardioides sp. 31GB23 TaxID=3156065 RepID=UPI0032B00792